MIHLLHANETFRFQN